jgi:hypothetical protein
MVKKLLMSFSTCNGDPTIAGGAVVEGDRALNAPHLAGCPGS